MEIPESVAKMAMGGKNGAFVLIESETGMVSEVNTKAVNKALPPCSTFKALMQVRKTGNGMLYGKTGSRSSSAGGYNLGWFAESGDETYVFACKLEADNTSGLDARKDTESTRINR